MKWEKNLPSCILSGAGCVCVCGLYSVPKQRIKYISLASSWQMCLVCKQLPERIILYDFVHIPQKTLLLGSIHFI